MEDHEWEPSIAHLIKYLYLSVKKSHFESTRLAFAHFPKLRIKLLPCYHYCDVHNILTKGTQKKKENNARQRIRIDNCNGCSLTLKCFRRHHIKQLLLRNVFLSDMLLKTNEVW